MFGRAHLSLSELTRTSKSMILDQIHDSDYKHLKPETEDLFSDTEEEEGKGSAPPKLKVSSFFSLLNAPLPYLYRTTHDLPKLRPSWGRAWRRERR